MAALVEFGAETPDGLKMANLETRLQGDPVSAISRPVLNSFCCRDPLILPLGKIGVEVPLLLPIRGRNAQQYNYRVFALELPERNLWCTTELPVPHIVLHVPGGR